MQNQPPWLEPHKLGYRQISISDLLPSRSKYFMFVFEDTKNVLKILLKIGP